MRYLTLAAIAGLTLGLGCGDGGSAPNRNEFEGTWDASQVQFTNAVNTAEKVDLVAMGGVCVLILETGGTYEWAVTMPGEAPEITTGTWSVSSDVFTVKETGSSGDMQFDWSRNGTTLTLSGGHTGFDFNGDDIDEEARLRLVLVLR